ADPVGFAGLTPAPPIGKDRRNQVKPRQLTKLDNVRKSGMRDDDEITWHRKQIAKNRVLIEELEAGNTAGGDVFPETGAEIDRLKTQVEQSELIVAAHEKEPPQE